MTDNQSNAQRIAPRVLVIDPEGPSRASIVSLLRQNGIQTRDTADRTEGERIAGETDFDVVLLATTDTPETDFELTGRLSRSGRPARVIIMTASLEAKTGIEAMRHGAVDLLVKPLIASEVLERVGAAAEQAEALRRQARRIDRLKRVCKRLNDQQEEQQASAAAATALSTATDLLRSDADSEADMFNSLASKLSAMSMASDFGTKMRSELDVEMLLRTVLEHVLHTLGPTNAAVFLPTGEDEWSLGGYINYDVERESADIMLDRLADFVPHQIAGEESIVHFGPDDDLADRFGHETVWLNGSNIALCPCRWENDTLAVLMLFRGKDAPFTDELNEQLELMREIIADQLHRVVKVHNRAKPGEPWHGFSIGEDEGGDNYNGWGFAA